MRKIIFFVVQIFNFVCKIAYLNAFILTEAYNIPIYFSNLIKLNHFKEFAWNSHFIICSKVF